MSQRELANRSGVTQAAIARIEKRRTSGRFETVERLLEACGWELDVHPKRGLGLDRTAIREILRLPPSEWARLAVEEARNLEKALVSTTHPFDPLAALSTLRRHRVRFVIVGGFAGRLRGSPSLTNDLDICYARDKRNLAALAAALRELEATPRGAPEGLPFRLDARTLAAGDCFTFATMAGGLDCLGTPAGSAGFLELIRSADEMDLGGVRAPVAALADLMWMKSAADRPKDRIELEVLAALRDEIEKLQGES